MFHSEIEVTNLCNIRCIHCPHETISRPSGTMDMETFTTIAGKIRAYCRGEQFSLSFSGMGEPLLNPLIYDFISHVSADALTSFATNGSALTPRNIERLITAGLDTIYLSFNGADSATFSKMMGGLSFDRFLANARSAVRQAAGSRLRIKANVSVTNTNKHSLSRIITMLEQEGIGPTTVSLCHSRGGNLRDPAVCDTPPMPPGPFTCDVMKNTLFVDWQGIARICDHDLHGEHGLGDLRIEPLEAILARREQVLARPEPLKICRECTDVMKIGPAPLLSSGAGGNFRDWVRYLYEDAVDPLSEASPPLKWVFRIYEKEGRQDRFANHLLAIERHQSAELASARQELAQRRQEIALLETELAEVRRHPLWRAAGLARRVRSGFASLIRQSL